MPERRFLPSMRRSREALVGLVAPALDRRDGRLTDQIDEGARSASSRLRTWVRWRCAMMTSTPSRVSRAPASRSSRARTSGGSDGECRTSKRSCTAVDSLLTFCPPGPDDANELLLDLALVDGDLCGDRNHGRSVALPPPLWGKGKIFSSPSAWSRRHPAACRPPSRGGRCRAGAWPRAWRRRASPRRSSPAVW